MFGESVFALIPDHEVRAAILTNRWISGCWWGRDASSDEHLLGTKHGLRKCRSVRRKTPGEQWSRRETIEARGTKWNFDVEWILEYPDQLWNHVATRECRQQRPRWKFLQYLHFHLRQKNTYSRCKSGGGDVAVKKEMMICDTSCINPAKSKVIEEVKHSRSTYFIPAERGRQIDRHWSDHHYTEVTGTQERHERNDGIMGKTCHFRGQVHTYCEHRLGDSCNLPGIRVPKCTRDSQ